MDIKFAYLKLKTYRGTFFLPILHCKFFSYISLELFFLLFKSSFLLNFRVFDLQNLNSNWDELAVYSCLLIIFCAWFDVICFNMIELKLGPAMDSFQLLYKDCTIIYSPKFLTGTYCTYCPFKKGVNNISCINVCSLF